MTTISPQLQHLITQVKTGAQTLDRATAERIAAELESVDEATLDELRAIDSLEQGAPRSTETGRAYLHGLIDGMQVRLAQRNALKSDRQPPAVASWVSGQARGPLTDKVAGEAELQRILLRIQAPVATQVRHSSTPTDLKSMAEQDARYRSLRDLLKAEPEDLDDEDWLPKATPQQTMAKWRAMQKAWWGA
ncbi:MAG: hypothetical protein JXR83_13065 [Deltaproteobacteria bacterium]|nr:hypothetical protein [Deltaproteobacteria bacterium]